MNGDGAAVDHHTTTEPEISEEVDLGQEVMNEIITGMG